jgi:hypothetical protein
MRRLRSGHDNFDRGSGLTRAIMLALGLPIGSTRDDVCDLLAIGSGIFFVGLVDNR